MTKPKATDKPKPGAADFSALNSPPVVREDVTERELAILGIVRHYASLGFDLRAYSSMIFGTEEQCRSPEDRIAGKLASEDATTFDRLLKDGVHFAASPRLMGMFMVCFQYQDVKRRDRWKKQFFAEWAPEKKTFRRRSLASIVLNMYQSRLDRGVGSKRAMGEIQRIHDSVLDGSLQADPTKDATSAEDLDLLKRYAMRDARGRPARVEELLDEARGQLGLRTIPKRPRVKRKRPEIA